MSFTQSIDRTGASALMPEEIALQLLTAVTEQSSVLAFSTRVPMSRRQSRIPVIDTLPVAYFLSGDTDLKRTSSISWDNVYLTAEEIAVIVPIPEAVIDDSEADVWGIARPLLEAAIARRFDSAVVFGDNKPASYPTAIVPGAAAASQTITLGANTAAEGGFGQDVLDAVSLVEQSGYEVTGALAPTRTKGALRKVRDTTGQRLAEISPTSIDGFPVRYPMRGLWPNGAAGDADLIVGDWSQSIVGVRQDITYKVLTESVIQDETGAIIHNLAQQDMVALRVVVRYGWALPNPINYEQMDAAARYPFATVVQS